LHNTQKRIQAKRLSVALHMLLHVLWDGEELEQLVACGEYLLGHVHVDSKLINQDVERCFAVVEVHGGY
jgi:hypothetical protein